MIMEKLEFLSVWIILGDNGKVRIFNKCFDNFL